MSFRHTFQFSSSFQSSPSSQVLEDLELKGRCGDLCNERFVPSSDNGKNSEQNLFERVIFSQNFTEMKITKQQTSYRKILYKMHGRSFTAHLKLPIQEEKKNRKPKDSGNLPHTVCVRSRLSACEFLCPFWPNSRKTAPNQYRIFGNLSFKFRKPVSSATRFPCTMIWSNSFDAHPSRPLRDTSFLKIELP